MYKIKSSRTLTFAALVAALLLQALHPAATAREMSDVLFLRGGTVIDPETRTVELRDLLIGDGQIIGFPDAVPDGFTGRVVDVSGKWILPGLIDMHVHSFGNQGPNRTFDNPRTAIVANRALYAGVTDFLDLFGDETALHGLRLQQARGELGGATIHASLSCLTAPDGHCTEYGIPTRVMSTPEEARVTVADLAKKNPSVIKIVYQPTDDQPSINKKTLAAAIQAADAAGLKTIVHIKTWQDVRDVIDAGGSAVTHTPLLQMPEDMPRTMANAGLVFIPTLAMHTDLVAYLYQDEVLNSPLANSVASAKMIAAYQSAEVRETYQHRQADWLKRNAEILAKVKRISDAGVVVLAGTDSGNWGTLQGFSLHRELVRLVESGLSSWQALASATTLAGDFLGLSHGVSLGDRASLLILDKNPIKDIEATQSINAVVHRGNLIDRGSLQLALE